MNKQGSTITSISKCQLPKRLTLKPSIPNVYCAKTSTPIWSTTCRNVYFHWSKDIIAAFRIIQYVT